MWVLMHRMLEKHCLETCSPMSKLEIRSEAASWLSCLACLDTESDLACMLVASKHLGCASRANAPKLHAFVFLRSAKTSLSKSTKRAVYTSVSLSVSSPGSSLGVHQRSLWVSMANPRMDEEHQDSGRKRRDHWTRCFAPDQHHTPRYPK